MLLTVTSPDPRPVLDSPPPAGRAFRSDRLPRWAVAAAIGALPLLTPQGPANTAPVDGFILLAMAAALLWAGWNRQRLRFPYGIGVGTMVVAGSIAALAGNYPHEGALAILIDIFLLGWAATVANLARTSDAAGFFVRAWCVTGSAWGVGFVAVIGHAAATSGAAAVDATRAGFTLGEQNGAGFYFAVTILMILAGRWPRRLRWRLPVLGCLLYDLLLTGSLAGLTGWLAGVALALVVRTAVRRGAAAALALFLVLAVVGVASEKVLQQSGVVERAQSSQNSLVRLSIGRAQQSAWERETLTRETLHLFSTSGLLGLGPNATKSTLLRQQAPYPKQAHDDWTAVLVERGLLGFAGLLLLVGEIVWRARTVGSRRRLADLSTALPAPEFLIGALATLAVYSFTHEQLHDRTAWTMLGVLAAFSLWHWHGRRPASPAVLAADRAAAGVARAR